MSEPLLPCVEIEPVGAARAAVIWLHGLGADGHDFEPIVPHLGLPRSAAIRFVFPHAPAMPVTLNGGMVMPAWYDISGLDLDRKPDEAGIRRSAAQVSRLVDRENSRGIPCESVVLAGFSQGGVIALHAGLRRSERLAGIVALSTYLALEDTLDVEGSANNRDTPLLIAHGVRDPMVPCVLGRRSSQFLESRGHPVDYREYDMAHEVCLEEIGAIGEFLAARLVAKR
jgi:phospholipase/carboxylesterase